MRAAVRSLARRVETEPKGMLGAVPPAVAEDREFFLLFSESKDAEAELKLQEANRLNPRLFNPMALKRAQDEFDKTVAKMRARWALLVRE